MNLVTIQEYKDYKGINSSNQDTKLNIVIPSISRLIQSYCNREFIGHAYDVENDLPITGDTPLTQTYDATLSAILVKEFPIMKVVSVKTSTDGGTTKTDLVEGTDFYVDYSLDTVVSASGSFSSSTLPNSLTIEYYGGYITAPDDIKLCTFELIDHYVSEKYIQGRQLKGSSQDMAPTAQPTTLPIHIKQILDLYRVI
jgi:hypothetical protein